MKSFRLQGLITTILLAALVWPGCACNDSIPIDEIEDPVAYIARPPSALASFVEPILLQPVSSWGDREVMIMDAATGATWQVTSNGRNELQPTWSPSGTHLMYLSMVDPAWISTNSYPTTLREEIFVYDLEERTSEHVDLSWALDSGPASAQIAPDELLDVGWLECAAWSPVDTTKIAVGVQVDIATFMNPEREKHRLVLLDTEEKTGRFLARYDGRCASLLWSADGRYLHAQTSKKLFIETDSGKTHDLKGSHTVQGDTLNYAVLDWMNETVIVRGYGRNIDDYVLYGYDVQREKWSTPLEMVSRKNKVLAFAPIGPDDEVDSVDYIVRRDSAGGYYEDFWRYHRPEGIFERLTYDGMPKREVTSYDRKRPPRQDRRPSP